MEHSNYSLEGCLRVGAMPFHMCRRDFCVQCPPRQKDYTGFLSGRLRYAHILCGIGRYTYVQALDPGDKYVHWPLTSASIEGGMVGRKMALSRMHRPSRRRRSWCRWPRGRRKMVYWTWRYAPDTRRHNGHHPCMTGGVSVSRWPVAL